MKKLLILAIALSPLMASAGVVKFAAKQSYHAAKHAAHYSVKAGKVAKKVLY